MNIRILDSELVSMIAAGEVIERPASVVKELVENSIDAGSTQIDVEIHNGGLSLIKVTDNGQGIAHSEVELAFQRHATSKLRSLSDLETINSLGFRGEALPSIAAVADVRIETTARGETAGTMVKLSDSATSESTITAHAQGTSITVEHLFHTTPARLKFMKSSRAESARTAYLMSQFALAFPGVRFSLTIDGRTTLRTTGTGKLRDAVAQVYGTDVAAEMLDLPGARTEPGAANPDSFLPTVSGLVSPPQLSRSGRSYVSFFVNRRWIYDRTLARAVDEAYQGLLMIGRQPIIIMNISVPATAVDVNVHPTKREVRFRHESLVFSTVNRAVKKALSGSPVPQINISGAPAWSAGRFTDVQPAGTKPMWQDLSGPQPHSWPVDWDKAERGQDKTSLRVMGQIDNTYVVAEAASGLFLVDQHAAHERILFDRIRLARADDPIDIQGLLEPTVLELSPEQDEVIRMRWVALAGLGFGLESFGDRSYIVRSVPAALKDADIPATISEILASAGKLEDQEWLDQAAASIACHGAIRAGQKLDGKEASELLRQLEETTSPRTCPHGRPTMIHLSSGELRRHFGRE